MKVASIKMVLLWFRIWQPSSSPCVGEIVKLKIGFVGPLPPPLGGVAVINRSLQEVNYGECEKISFNTSSNDLREKIYSAPGISSVVRNFRLMLQLFVFLRNCKLDVVNVFVTSGLSIFRDLFFLVIIKLFGVPVIIHFHSKTEGEFLLRPLRLKIASYFFRHLSKKVLVLSDYHLGFFSKYFGNDKCAVLENFVRYSDYSCSIDKKTNRLLYVGRLTREKGFFDLLEALKVVTERGVRVHVDVVGLAQSDEDEAQIKRLISDYKIGHAVHLHGALFGSDKFDLFKRSACLLFPSHFENSPVVIKEAIAAKMGIIATDIVGNMNILDGLHNSLFFRRGYPEQLATRIIELATDNCLALQLCRASAEVLKYDESFARQKMQKIIAEVTNGRA